MIFSVAFGGGAFRGVGHIGVIKYFEENNLHPKCISGTSIGGVIGALYSLGFSAQEMEKFAEEIHWKNFFKPSLKHGLINKKLIVQTLDSYIKGATFEETKIPLKIIATNFDTGEKKIFEKGSILEAILASISIPGLFIPHKIHSTHYIDGSVTENLPLSCLPEEGIKIGVSVQIPIEFLEKKKKKPKFTFLSHLNTIRKSMSITMINNENETIEKYKKDSLLIRLGEYHIGYYDFKQTRQIIEAGYQAAQENITFKDIGI